MVECRLLYAYGRVIRHRGYWMIAVKYPDIDILELLGLIGRRLIIHFKIPGFTVSFYATPVREGKTAYIYIPKPIWLSFETLHHYNGLMMIEVREHE